MNNFSRIIPVVSILVFTGILGLVRLPYLFGVSFNDLCYLILVSYTIIAFRTKKFAVLQLWRCYASKALLLYVIFIFSVAFSMIFREEGSLITGLKAARHYTVILIIIPIYIDLKRNTKSEKFWLNYIVFIGVWYSFVVLLNIISSSLAESIFKSIIFNKADGIWDTNATRYVIKSNSGILFIYLAFVIAIYRYIVQNQKNHFLILILVFGVLLQGWRAILIATIFSLFVAMLSFRLTKSFKELIPTIVLIILILVPLDFFVNRSISSKFISVRNEISGDYEGTFSGRLRRAEIYAIPEFMKKPFFGHGFVHEESIQVDVREKSYDKTYLLYNFDFGYLTLLNIFGIIPFMILMFMLFRGLRYLVMNRSIVKSTQGAAIYANFVFLLSLIIANYTFGGLISILGLLPLSIITAISSARTTL